MKNTPKNSEERFLRILQATPDKLARIDRVLADDRSVLEADTKGPAMLTIAATARTLSCSRASVYRLIWSGRLRCHHLLARSPRIPRVDVETLIAGTSEPTP